MIFDSFKNAFLEISEITDAGVQISFWMAVTYDTGQEQCPSRWVAESKIKYIASKFEEELEGDVTSFVKADVTSIDLIEREGDTCLVDAWLYFLIYIGDKWIKPTREEEKLVYEVLKELSDYVRGKDDWLRKYGFEGYFIIPDEPIKFSFFGKEYYIEEV